MFLSDSTFSFVVKNTPLIAIDLCIVKGKKILVGKRLNSPAKNYFFVPGGRILKSELKKNALKRILKSELGLKFKKNHEKFVENLGIYEHFYNDNFLGEKDFGTHYVVIAYLIPYDCLERVKKESLIEQHSEYIWIVINNFDKETVRIHKYTLDYLENPLISNL